MCHLAKVLSQMIALLPRLVLLGWMTCDGRRLDSSWRHGRSRAEQAYIVLVSSRLRGEAIRYRLCRADSSDVAAKLFCVVCIAQESGLEAGVAVRTATCQPHKELASSSNCLDKPAVYAIIRRRINSPIQMTQFALAAKYQRYGLAPE
jgi:hypothetical protein